MYLMGELDTFFDKTENHRWGSGWILLHCQEYSDLNLFQTWAYLRCNPVVLYEIRHYLRRPNVLLFELSEIHRKSLIAENQIMFETLREVDNILPPPYAKHIFSTID